MKNWKKKQQWNTLKNDHPQARIKEWKKEGIKEVAKNLKDIFSDEEIAEHTGLSIEEIKKL